jgi:NAD-dependent dihydropyrimidine dehydrogenase PreA subunit
MAVIINFKICDNAKDCNGIAVCPTGALAWDEKKQRIKINNKKCISCRKCEKACMTESIHVSKNKKEYRKIQKEIKDDPRHIGDLFVDRYGAQPINPAFITPENKFERHILEYDKLSAVEFFNNDSIMCLLKSIPIKELIGPMNIRYRKVEVGKGLAKKYQVKKLPALLFFKKGRLLGKIEGFWEAKKREDLREKIEKLKIHAPQ